MKDIDKIANMFDGIDLSPNKKDADAKKLRLMAHIIYVNDKKIDEICAMLKIR